MDAWLTINYGAAYTRAVLTWPDGTWTTLPFGGTGELSSAVHAGGPEVLVGVAAWQAAEIQPDGFILSPLRTGSAQVHAGAIDIDTADLVAATLRHVGYEAAELAGDPIDRVRLVVPAGWGPRRRTWMRRATAKASLPVTEVVAAPIAALRQAPGAFAPGQVVLVIDVGAGCEVTVCQRDTTGYETLSILADPDAGGDQVDVALLAAVTGGGLDALPASQRWSALAAARAAKQSLEHHPAVTMPLPGGRLPVAISAAVLRQVAQPSAERIAALAVDALANAELSLDRVQAVYAIGGGAAAAVDMIADKLGPLPQVLDQPAWAAALGAADAISTPGTDAGVRTPPLRRLVSLGLPALASLALYAHFVFSVEFYNGTPQAPRPYFYSLAAWGELTVAAVFAVITLLQAGPLLALVQSQQSPRRPAGAAGAAVTTGLAMAIAGGLAVAGMYGVVAAVFMGKPATALLTWSLLPVLPTAASAAVLLAVIWRQGRAPEHGWDPFLSFPPSSVLAGTAGILGLALSWQSTLAGRADLVAAAGAALMAVALACTVFRHLGVRIGLSVLLSLMLLIISRSGPDIAAIVYALTVAAWWAQRAWAALRLPA